MSKPLSYHFRGTTGERKFKDENDQYEFEDDIIKERVQGLDLTEHPVKHKSDLSLKKIIKKIKDNTATKEEYQKYDRIKRLSDKRKEAVKAFWEMESERIKNHQRTTRHWTAEQRAEILKGGRPKVNGKTMQGHHTYSVSKYPQLAGYHNVIFPVTFAEHLYDWHGGNFHNSLPGRPFKRKRVRRNKK